MGLTDDAAADPGPNARDRLLDAVVSYGGAHGLADRSLRTIASGVGSSHRMLLHHFGSRDGLLIAVVQEVERRQRDALAGLVALERSPSTQSAATPSTDPSPFETTHLDQPDRTAVGAAFWARLSDPALAPLERLFFELYAQALLGAPWAADFLDGIVETWVTPVAELLEAEGVDRHTARARARLGVAVSRGLLLDLLATGDHDGVDAAMDEFLRLVA